MKERQAYQQVKAVADIVERNQDVGSGARTVSSHNWHTPTPKMPQPKTDATDRRQIEARNEDKSHTSKETLDDIKRIHQKEKNKKQETDIGLGQTRNASEGEVS